MFVLRLVLENMFCMLFRFLSMFSSFLICRVVLFLILMLLLVWKVSLVWFGVCLIVVIVFLIVW